MEFGKKNCESLNLESHVIYDFMHGYEKSICKIKHHGYYNIKLCTVIEKIINEYDLSSIKRINLANNYISIYGAIDLFKFVLDKLPNIEVIDLSKNDINDARHPEFDNLSKLLTEVLKKDKFKFMILKDNRAFLDREKLIYNPNKHLIDKLPIACNVEECDWMKDPNSSILK
jgi:hypothetical protein